MYNVIKLTNLSHFVVGYFLCYTKNKRGKVMLDQIKTHLLDSINNIVFVPIRLCFILKKILVGKVS